MKLWFQSLIRPIDHNNVKVATLEETPFGGLLRKLLNGCASPGTEIHIEGLSNSSGMGVHYRFLEYNDTKEIIYNAIRAEKEGYDAFLVGNISDAGLREAREMVNIPVLGACESTLHFACMMGATFGLITISEKWTPRLIENVERCGLSSRLVGCEALNTSPLELKKAVHDLSLREAIMADIMAASRRLLKRGAEVIVPAGGDVVVFLADANIYQLEGAPILVSHAALIKMAEAAVRLKEITGVFTSKHLQYAPPTGDFLKRVRDFYGPDVYPGAE
jgi:allantoin racemase